MTADVAVGVGSSLCDVEADGPTLCVVDTFSEREMLGGGVGVPDCDAEALCDRVSE